MYQLLNGEDVLVESTTPIIYDPAQWAWHANDTWWTDVDRAFTVAGAPTAGPTDWLIDIGPFFDRFGAAKMSILSSENSTMRAILQDVMARKWIDLQRADVGQSIDVMIALGLAGVDAALKLAVLTTPVTPNENLALRRMFF